MDNGSDHRVRTIILQAEKPHASRTSRASHCYVPVASRLRSRSIGTMQKVASTIAEKFATPCLMYMIFISGVIGDSPFDHLCPAKLENSHCATKKQIIYANESAHKFPAHRTNPRSIFKFPQHKHHENAGRNVSANAR